MFAAIRKMFNVGRLERELEATKEEVKELELRLAYVRRSSYSSVATDFDASIYYEDIKERVVQDLAPILREDALQALITGFASLARKVGCPLEGRVAYNTTEMALSFNFKLRPYSTFILYYGEDRI